MRETSPATREFVCFIFLLYFGIFFIPLTLTPQASPLYAQGPLHTSEGPALRPGSRLYPPPTPRLVPTRLRTSNSRAGRGRIHALPADACIPHPHPRVQLCSGPLVSEARRPPAPRVPNGVLGVLPQTALRWMLAPFSLRLGPGARGSPLTSLLAPHVTCWVFLPFAPCRILGVRERAPRGAVGAGEGGALHRDLGCWERPSVPWSHRPGSGRHGHTRYQPSDACHPSGSMAHVRVTGAPDWAWPSPENSPFPVKSRLSILHLNSQQPRKVNSWPPVPGALKAGPTGIHRLADGPHHSTDILKSATLHFFSESTPASPPGVCTGHRTYEVRAPRRWHLRTGSRSLRGRASHPSCPPENVAQSRNSLPRHRNVAEPSFIPRGPNPRVPGLKGRRPWTAEATNHRTSGTWAGGSDKWPRHGPPWCRRRHAEPAGGPGRPDECPDRSRRSHRADISTARPRLSSRAVRGRHLGGFCEPVSSGSHSRTSLIPESVGQCFRGRPGPGIGAP